MKLVCVKGHASNAGNNRCDEMAVAASRSASLLIDEGFEAAKRAVEDFLLPGEGQTS